MSLGHTTIAFLDPSGKASHILGTAHVGTFSSQLWWILFRWQQDKLNFTFLISVCSRGIRSPALPQFCFCYVKAKKGWSSALLQLTEDIGAGTHLSGPSWSQTPADSFCPSGSNIPHHWCSRSWSQFVTWHKPGQSSQDAPGIPESHPAPKEDKEPC